MNSPKKLLQIFSWENQERFQSFSPMDRLKWLETINILFKQGAHYRKGKNKKSPPLSKRNGT